MSRCCKKDTKSNKFVWAVVPNSYTAKLIDYDDLGWFEPFYPSEKAAAKVAARINKALKNFLANKIKSSIFCMSKLFISFAACAFMQ